MSVSYTSVHILHILIKMGVAYSAVNSTTLTSETVTRKKNKQKSGFKTGNMRGNSEQKKKQCSFVQNKTIFECMQV